MRWLIVVLLAVLGFVALATVAERIARTPDPDEGDELPRIRKAGGA